MKHTINTFINGIGFLFVMVGFIMCLGAAGNCDLDYSMVDVIPYIKAGMVSVIGGVLFTGLKIR